MGVVFAVTERPMTAYLRFVEAPQSPDRKTKTIAVVSALHGDQLGTIKWFGRWRQYAFFPERETIYNSECLDAITEQIRGLMFERRMRSTAYDVNRTPITPIPSAEQP